MNPSSKSKTTKPKKKVKQVPGRASHWGCSSLKCNWHDGPCKYILREVEVANRLGILNWRRKGR